MPAQKKISTVENLNDRLTKAKSVVLTNHQGLTHQQMEQLRRLVKKAGGDFIVVKNSLLKLAAKQTQQAAYENLAQSLTGATALLLSYGDVFSPLKEVAAFIKKFQLPSFKIGLLENQTLNDQELMSAATLPSKEVLLANLIWQIKSPLSRLAHACAWNIQKLALTLKAIETAKQRKVVNFNGKNFQK